MLCLGTPLVFHSDTQWGSWVLPLQDNKKLNWGICSVLLLACVCVCVVWYAHFAEDYLPEDTVCTQFVGLQWTIMCNLLTKRQVQAKVNISKRVGGLIVWTLLYLHEKVGCIKLQHHSSVAASSQHHHCHYNTDPDAVLYKWLGEIDGCLQL